MSISKELEDLKDKMESIEDILESEHLSLEAKGLYCMVKVLTNNSMMSWEIDDFKKFLYDYDLFDKEQINLILEELRGFIHPEFPDV